MKKLALFLLMFTLMTAPALAEVDLSGMSYDELVALKDQINLAIWQSDTWQEVEVPAGLWIVGEDIPAGKWTIKAADGITAYIKWGDKKDESGTDITYGGNVNESEIVTSVTYKRYEKGDVTEVSWDLKDGQYFVVDSGIALFTPYAGKPSLGFK